MKHRPNNRDGLTTHQKAVKSANPQNNGNDYYRSSTEIKPSEARPITKRISQARLEELQDILSRKDYGILARLYSCRYLMTGQIQRLFFYKSSTPKAASTATTRTMRRLRDYGLVSTFDRRIGGQRAGSASFVWHLTEGGVRLINLETDNVGFRKRFIEPSHAFMRHTLSVAECYIQIVELCRKSDKLGLMEVQFEPECWRQFHLDRQRLSLNPDLFVVTHSGGYEDRWFIEVDLSTESPATVIFKCQRYHDYYNSRMVQKRNEVFPYTLWIVPDISRKEKLTEKIKSEFQNKLHLFRVITMDELEDVLVNGCSPELLL